MTKFDWLKENTKKPLILTIPSKKGNGSSVGWTDPYGGSLYHGHREKILYSDPAFLPAITFAPGVRKSNRSMKLVRIIKDLSVLFISLPILMILFLVILPIVVGGSLFVAFATKIKQIWKGE